MRRGILPENLPTSISAIGNEYREFSVISADSSHSSILVIKGGALGDCLMALPLLGTLERRAPSFPKVLATRERLIPLFLAWGGWDRIFSLDGGDFPQRLAEEARRAEGILYLRDDLPQWLPLLQAGGARVAGGSPHPPPDTHVLAHLHGFLDSLFPPSISGEDPPDPMTSPPLSWKEEGRNRLISFGLLPETSLVLVPGAGKVHTRWPLVHFHTLLDPLRSRGWEPVWLLGPQEEEQGLRVEGAPVIRCADPLETARILAGSSLVIGNDTGCSHLAALVGTPLVVLFGATDPRQWAPRGRRVRVLGDGQGGMEALRPETVLDEVGRLC